MSRISAAVKTVTAAAALGLAFYAGRSSSPAVDAVTARPVRSSSRSTAPPDASRAAGVKQRPAEARELDTMGPEEISRLVRSLKMKSQPGNLMSPPPSEPETKAAWARWGEVDADAAIACALSLNNPVFRANALNYILTPMAERNPEAAQALLDQLPNPMLRAQLRNTVMTAAAEKDPWRWIEQVSADSSVPGLKVDVQRIVRKWAEADPAAAAARFETVSKEAVRAEALDPIVSGWSELDPAAALAWARTLTRPGERKKAVGIAAEAYANHDPEGALRDLESFPASMRGKVMTQAFNKLSQDDFEGALARAKTIPGEAERNEVLTHFASDLLIGGDLERFHGVLSDISSPGTHEQMSAFLAMAAAVMPHEDADTLLASMPGTDGASLRREMAEVASELDPERSVALLATLPPDGRTGEVYAAIAKNMSFTNPAVVLAFALGRDDAESREACVKAAFEGLAEIDPASATGRLKDLPEGPLQDTACTELAEKWGESDPVAASAWAEGLPAERKNAILKGLLPAVAKSDPLMAAAASTRLLSASPGDDDVSTTVREVASIWSKTDPSSAAPWALALPEGSARTEAIASVAGNWAGLHPDAAEGWMASLPEGEVRDAAAASMADQASEGMESRAFGWAAGIGDPEKRSTTLESVVSSWAGNDAAAARAAITGAGLPNAETKRLLDALEK